MTLPLQGMTVLDLSRLLPGPLCTLHLQDMGARVIKVEDTGAGDYTRSMGMPIGLVSPAFHLLNRGKESISIDLTQADGQALFMSLVARADIVVESFRPGVMKKLGLDYARLKSLNPKLVMCSISGFGQTGPWADKAGHDMNYCAISGVLDQSGGKDTAPALSNFQVADIAGGALSAAMSILAALVGSLRHGEGSYLDISMTDCAFANNLIPLTTMNLLGKAMPRGDDMLTGARPCYGVYPTADQRYMAVGALEKKFWEQVCDVLQKPEWKSRYNDAGKAADELKQQLTELFSRQPQQYWRDLFADSDCCVTPILTPQEAFEHPQLLAREMTAALKTEQGMTIHYPATPFSFNDEKSQINTPAPKQGEHSEALLAELGISTQQIQQWLAAGVIATAG